MPVTASAIDRIRTVDEQINEDVATIETDDSGAGALVTSSGRRIPLADLHSIRLARLEHYHAGPDEARIVLRSGEVVNAKITGGDDESVTLRSASLGAVSIPLELVRGILFPPAAQEPLRVRAFEQHRLVVKSEDDVVFLNTGGQAKGTVERVDTTGVLMEAEGLGSGINLDPSRVESLVLTELDAMPPTPPGTQGLIRLRDGSLLHGTLGKFQGGDRLRLDCGLGAGFEVTAREIASITVRGGRCVALSELEPTTTRQAFGAFDAEQPLFPWDERFSWKRNRTCLGDPIVLSDEFHESGLGVHSRTELRYKLEGAYTTFRSLVAMDESAREPSSVRPSVTFQVLVDGTPRLGDGLLVHSDDDPRMVEVDLDGAQELVLVVDFGDELGVHARGRAVWADAYLVR